jgi:hypothetical protein
MHCRDMPPTMIFAAHILNKSVLLIRSSCSLNEAGIGIATNDGEYGLDNALRVI